MPLPTVILPGFFAAASEYREFERLLNEQGFPAMLVPLRKRDWVPTIGGRSIAPILRQLDTTVQQALREFNSKKINLVAHSAGGWIARIYLGEEPYIIHGDIEESAKSWCANPFVSTLITLGSPHISQERWTLKNLEFVNTSYPGAFYSHVRYVCLAGKAVYGAKKRGQWLAHNSYRITCGIGETWGDGITPIAAAHLVGAENITLEGVMHSPRSPLNWYGSPEILPQWVSYLE